MSPCLLPGDGGLTSQRASTDPFLINSNGSVTVGKEQLVGSELLDVGWPSPLSTAWFMQCSWGEHSVPRRKVTVESVHFLFSWQVARDKRELLAGSEPTVPAPAAAKA